MRRRIPPRLIVCAALTFALTAPARAAWLEATSDNFIVYSDGNPAALVNFTGQVEKFDLVLRIMTGLDKPPAPVKVRIYLVDGSSEVRELDPTHRPLAGFYSSRIDGGIAVVDREPARGEFSLSGQSILYHEYCHHYMAQYFPNAYPVWYQEGFAEYFGATVFDKDGTVEIGRVQMPRLPALAQGVWLSAQQLMNDTVEQLPTYQWDQFYAQGWLLTHYLFHNPTRHEQFRHYLLLRTQGVAHTEALQKAFGLDDKQLETELRAYFAKGKLAYSRLTNSRAKAPPVAIRELPHAEGELLLLALRAKLGMQEAEKPAILEHIRAKAAHFPGDEYAQVVLAEAEVHLGGDRARAQELLKATLAANPNNRRAMLDLAWWELSTKDLDSAARLESDQRARTLAVKANRLATTDPEALYLFYATFAHEAAGPSRNAIDALTEAYFNLPQYSPTAQVLANQELRDGKTDMAISILEPIAYSPHAAGPEAQKLRDWIAQMKARKSPAPADSSPHGPVQPNQQPTASDQ
jgi:hypothetical protein